MASSWQWNKVFNKRIISGLAVLALAALAVAILFSPGCLLPTFGPEATVLINPVFADFSPISEIRQAEGKEKQDILDWYKQIKVVKRVGNPSVSTEPPVPSILITPGQWESGKTKKNEITLVDIAGEYFYLIWAVNDNRPAVYLCRQENIEALFNQMRQEYKPIIIP